MDTNDIERLFNQLSLTPQNVKTIENLIKQFSHLQLPEGPVALTPQIKHLITDVLPQIDLIVLYYLSINNYVIRRLLLIDETWKFRIIHRFPNVNINDKPSELSFQKWNNLLVTEHTTLKLQSLEVKEVFSHYDAFFNIRRDSYRLGLTSYKKIKKFNNFDDTFHDIFSINIDVPFKIDIIEGNINYSYKTVSIERILLNEPITLEQIIFELNLYFKEFFNDTYYNMNQLVLDGIRFNRDSNQYQVSYKLNIR